MKRTQGPTSLNEDDDDIERFQVGKASSMESISKRMSSASIKTDKSDSSKKKPPNGTLANESGQPGPTQWFTNPVRASWLPVSLDISKEELEQISAFYTKMLILALAIFHTQDYVLDFVLAYQLYDEGHVQWASAALALCVAPLLGLFIFHVTKPKRLRKMHMPLLALIGMTYYLELVGSWQACNITKAFHVESDFYVLAESLPSFIFQSYIMLRNFFWVRDCEKAFDVVCTQECLSLQMLPKEFRDLYGEDFSRETCAAMANPEGSKQCWQWYSHCISACSVTAWLERKQQAMDEFRSKGGFLNANFFFSQESRTLRRRMADAGSHIKQVLKEESPDWFMNGCSESNSLYRTIMTLSLPANRPDFLGRWLYVEPGVDREGHYVSFDIKSMDFELFTIRTYVTIISLITSIVVVAGSLSMKAVKQDGRSKATNPKKQFLDMFGFFCHFMLDAVASAGAISFLYSSRGVYQRALPIVIAFCILEYEFWYGSARPTRLKWFQRIMAGFAYIPVSPLSRIPGWPSFSARLIRRVLLWRVLWKMACVYIGFNDLRYSDYNGATAWRATVFNVVVCIVFAYMATFLPGTNLIHTNDWDQITEKRLLSISEDLVAKRLRKVFLTWKMGCKKYAKEMEVERATMALFSSDDRAG
eukprot:gb/GFBE01079315.1/.p1 GENE.gb/GFBE01079315.1/~~gb/GFBE01079315.1/.p1  ORF type:complete len:647 (+),score=103.69 gb/GFBE01079315.1/:1-1941(+)